MTTRQHGPNPKAMNSLAELARLLIFPKILQVLEHGLYPDPNSCADSLFTTSMFGTGVDIPRLGLMIDQRSAKNYVLVYPSPRAGLGDRDGGLVVTLLRAFTAT